MLYYAFPDPKYNCFCFQYRNYIVSLSHKCIIMEQKARFKIIYSDETIEFLNTLDEKARVKIMYNVNKSKYVIDKELFKKLDDTDGIWEFRTLYNGITYRLLAFWDTDNEALVLTTHGFIKKTQKTPSKDITKAEEIRKAYFNSKK